MKRRLPANLEALYKKQYPDQLKKAEPHPEIKLTSEDMAQRPRAKRGKKKYGRNIVIKNGEMVA